MARKTYEGRSAYDEKQRKYGSGVQKPGGPRSAELFASPWDAKAKAAFEARPKCKECLCVLHHPNEKFHRLCIHCQQEKEDKAARGE